MIITGSFYDILQYKRNGNQNSNEEPISIVLLVSKAGSDCCKSLESTAEDKVKERKTASFAA